MIYSVAEIVSFASQSLTLLPGDLILTGTPSGVGAIQAGDELVRASWRLAAAAESGGKTRGELKKILRRRNLLGFLYIPL